MRLFQSNLPAIACRAPPRIPPVSTPATAPTAGAADKDVLLRIAAVRCCGTWSPLLEANSGGDDRNNSVVRVCCCGMEEVEKDSTELLSKSTAAERATILVVDFMMRMWAAAGMSIEKFCEQSRDLSYAVLRKLAIDDGQPRVAASRC